ncbi:MAG: ATP-binding protein [Acidobacteria bacterium]|nr:ATP-binding protein [Acidobacteriota bacterium]
MPATDCQEIVIISGKGGTGKTSLVAALAVHFGSAILVDCDVDAADLHLLLSPEILEKHEFYSGHEAEITAAHCTGCGSCHNLCRFNAIQPTVTAHGREIFLVDPLACEGCGVCVHFCPVGAIAFPERRCGEWYISSTRCGPMVHARLDIAAENSGKLVSTVRREARRLAEKNHHRLILVDGPPGIGCPVIAALTGASLVVIVTEPTVAGEHDLERVLALCRHFRIPTLVCLNKWDLNPEMTVKMEQNATRAGAGLLGRIRYDPEVTRAQLLARTVMEHDCAAGADIARISENLVHVGRQYGISI